MSILKFFNHASHEDVFDDFDVREDEKAIFFKSINKIAKSLTEISANLNTICSRSDSKINSFSLAQTEKIYNSVLINKVCEDIHDEFVKYEGIPLTPQEIMEIATSFVNNNYLKNEMYWDILCGMVQGKISARETGGLK